MKAQMTYAGTGVDYDAMDPWKRIAQEAGRATSKHLSWNGFREVEWSRGESCYLVEGSDHYLAHVEEGLGTKNLVADAMYRTTGRSYYDQIAQDCVAMIVNDMITVGAEPVSIAMHLAVGDSNWFKDEGRCRDLVNGWRDACDLARCVWGGGETPTLKGIIEPGRAVLSGSAMGVVKPKENLLRGNIQDGDAIILLESSGIHANGLTMARKIARKLHRGYLTRFPDGRDYGDALLDPTHIYVPFVEDAIDFGVEIHYAVNITGHGWRKLMRANGNFTYVIERLPTQLSIFDFIQRNGPVDDREAYGNFNMGAGFALYAPESAVSSILRILDINKYGYRGFVAGHIEASEKKAVVIEPKGLKYEAETLSVR